VSTSVLQPSARLPGSVTRMGEPHFVAEVASDNGTAIIRCAGELDLFSADEWSQGISQALVAQQRDIEVDMAGVTFIDSFGIRLFAMARQQFREGGMTIRVVNPSTAVRRLEALTGAFHLGDDAN
jgi:anti-sigma B factor antagonist